MKILIVQLGFLGDVILSTPVISGIRQVFPKAEISVLTTPQAAPFLRFHPEIHEVLVFEKRTKDAGLRGLFRLASEIRKREFGIAVSLHKSFRTAALLLLSRIPRTLGFREAALWWTYSKTIRRKHLQHDVLRNLVILELLGARLEDLPQEMKIVPGEKASEAAAELLSSLPKGPVVGIAPGSVWATKRWTEAGFRHLLQLLLGHDFPVVLLGGPDEVELCEKIAGSSTGDVLNLAGKTSLLESTAVIEKLSVLITNDSSPLHMASATGTPVVAIFCATVPEFGYGPWKVPHEIVQVEKLACRPCGPHGGNTCPTGTHACQIGVRPEMVFAAAQRLIRSDELRAGIS